MWVTLLMQNWIKISLDILVFLISKSFLKLSLSLKTKPFSVYLLSESYCEISQWFSFIGAFVKTTKFFNITPCVLVFDIYCLYTSPYSPNKSNYFYYIFGSVFHPEGYLHSLKRFIKVFPRDKVLWIYLIDQYQQFWNLFLYWHLSSIF